MQSGLLNAHHARRVNDLPPCAEGFSRDHISPPCRIGSENIPKSKHSVANIALSPGRIACTRGDIKADETGSYGLASGVNSQTASPTGSSAGATPRDLTLPAMPADTSYAYSDTNSTYHEYLIPSWLGLICHAHPLCTAPMEGSLTSKYCPHCVVQIRSFYRIEAL
jgi:hypothetical protein